MFLLFLPESSTVRDRQLEDYTTTALQHYKIQHRLQHYTTKYNTDYSTDYTTIYSTDYSTTSQNTEENYGIAVQCRGKHCSAV